jgi:hypothetical protein
MEESTSLQTCQKIAQIAISRAINEYRRIAKVSAPDDELSLQSQMLMPDIVVPASHIVIGTQLTIETLRFVNLLH